MSTLFAFCVSAGGEDTLLDVLDAVADRGVPDADWDWLKWTDVRGRIFCVVRGTLAARGAFHQPDLTRQIRVSVAHEFATDNRAQWQDPPSASEGRERLDEWLSDAGVRPATGEVIEAALPRTEVDVAPLVLRGRQRLEQVAIPLGDGPASTSGGEGRGVQRRSGQSDRRPRTAGGGNSVLAAFSAAIQSEKDSQGRGFSLYALQSGEDADAAAGDTAATEADEGNILADED